MKYFLILIALFSLSLKAVAQKKQNVYYFNKDNIEVKNPDSLYYSRIIQEPDSGSTFYNLIEFYKDGKIKTRGKVSKFKPMLIYHGMLFRNFENGNKASVSNYKNGFLVGSEYLYYTNGNPKEERLYFENKEKTYNPKRIIYKTISVYNQKGENLLDQNNSGTINNEDENGNREVGTYLNGLKVGTWQSYSKKENETYTDEYQDGVFIIGKTTQANGEILKYTEMEKMPEFKGGTEAFGKFLASKLTYPPDAYRSRIQGKVYVYFIVNPDGRLSDFEVEKSVSVDIDHEAIRVLKLSPKWNTGLQRGKPVRVSYIIPINFKLQ